VCLYDLTFARFSEYPTAASDLTFEVDVGLFNPFVRLPPKRIHPPPGFHDLLIPRVGAEYRAYERDQLAVDVRGGYAYEPTPVPEQVGGSNFADADKHTFAAGVGLDLTRLQPILERPLSLDAHLGVTYLPDRPNRKLDPLDAVGDFVAGGVVVQVGMTLRSRF
jgi:long-chain fatty acid transport protein